MYTQYIRYINKCPLYIVHYHKYVILMRHIEITQDITAVDINQKIEPEKLLSRNA